MHTQTHVRVCIHIYVCEYVHKHTRTHTHRGNDVEFQNTKNSKIKGKAPQ